jgi:hypothetical protein
VRHVGEAVLDRIDRLEHVIDRAQHAAQHLGRRGAVALAAIGMGIATQVDVDELPGLLPLVLSMTSSTRYIEAGACVKMRAGVLFAAPLRNQRAGVGHQEIRSAGPRQRRATNSSSSRSRLIWKVSRKPRRCQHVDARAAERLGGIRL